jgi:hypothetical protein
MADEIDAGASEQTTRVCGVKLPALFSIPSNAQQHSLLSSISTHLHVERQCRGVTAFGEGLGVTTDPQLSIYRSATIWFELKGTTAISEASRMMSEAGRRGDARAAEIWDKIISALADIEQRVLSAL